MNNREITGREIEEVRERRLAACIKIVEDAYQVDGYGVAELIGVSKQKWTRNANRPWDKKTSDIFIGLSRLTGVLLSWLFAEDLGAAKISELL